MAGLVLFRDVRCCGSTVISAEREASVFRRIEGEERRFHTLGWEGLHWKWPTIHALLWNDFQGGMYRTLQVVTFHGILAPDDVVIHNIVQELNPHCIIALLYPFT